MSCMPSRLQCLLRAAAVGLRALVCTQNMCAGHRCAEGRAATELQKQIRHCCRYIFPSLSITRADKSSAWHRTSRIPRVMTATAPLPMRYHNQLVDGDRPVASQACAA